LITISAGLAPILVAALRDSFKHRSEVVHSNEVGDVSDVEEFLVSLGLLEGEVRKQYLALQRANPQMIPYRELWPEIDDEPSDPPELKLVDR
jgi:hypothetical protein